MLYILIIICSIFLLGVAGKLTQQQLFVTKIFRPPYGYHKNADGGDTIICDGDTIYSPASGYIFVDTAGNDTLKTFNGADWVNLY